jgi:hypothetical protein
MSPYGTWANQCGIGQWLPLLGWVSTHSNDCGCWYSGVDVNIDLGAACNITDAVINYDVFNTTGPVDSCLDAEWVGIYDLDNGHWMGSPLAPGAVTDGAGQTWHSGPSTGPTQHLHVVVIASEALSEAALGSAVSNLNAVAVSGTSTNPPC